MSLSAWDWPEFESRLRAKESGYHIHHPFNRRLNQGGLAPFQVRGWVANRYHYQVSIPIKDAAILANCDDRATRRHWVKRLLDHDGNDDFEGGHAGGIEAMFAPRIHADRLAGWPALYPWIEADGLDYFRSRIPLARRDVEHGLSIARAWCDTRERQERALEILQFKLDILWAMLDAVATAYPDDLPEDQRP